MLVNSKTNLTYYNQSDPSQWYNHSIVHNLTYYKNIIKMKENDEDPNHEDLYDIELLLIILVIGAIIAGPSIVFLVIRRNRQKTQRSKTLKHNPKLRKT